MTSRQLSPRMTTLVCELLGRLSGGCEVEVNHDDPIDPRFGQQFESTVEARDQSGGRIRIEYGRRVRVERHDDRLKTELERTISHESEKVSVPEVNAVVDADGDDAPRGARLLNGATHNDHGRNATGRR